MDKRVPIIILIDEIVSIRSTWFLRIVRPLNQDNKLTILFGYLDLSLIKPVETLGFLSLYPFNLIYTETLRVQKRSSEYEVRVAPLHCSSPET